MMKHFVQIVIAFVVITSSGIVLSDEATVPANEAAAGQVAAMPALDRNSNETERRAAAALLARQPLSFIRNDGQADPRVRYYAQRGGFASYFTQEAAVLAFRQAAQRDGTQLEPGQDGQDTASGRAFALALTYLGANPDATIEGQDEAPGRYNFLIGADPAAWHQNVPGFRRVVYRDLWPGIDMSFTEEQGRLKYSFVVHPGADPDRIRLAYRGAEGLTLRDDGALLIATELGDLVDERPVSYQLVDGRKQFIETKFRLTEGDENGPAFRFDVAAARSDRHALVIDPGLVFSTYLDGHDNQDIYSLALDSLGQPVVVGYTFDSVDFPTTSGAYDTTFNGGFIDAFVTKFTADGSALVFSTFLGGTSDDSAWGVAVDSLDRPVVVGQTNGGGFPTTSGAYDTTHNGGGDGFVTKLTADGTGLVFSTFLGSSGFDRARSVAVDSQDRPVVAGRAGGANFPTTSGAYDELNNGGTDAFVTQFTADGIGLVFSTFLGGSSTDIASSVALDSQDRPVVAGYTFSGTFPTTSGAFNETLNGNTDAFVTKLSADGDALVFSTFLGGSLGDTGESVAVDSQDRPVVVGQTSDGGFPTTSGAFNETSNGNLDAFVTQFTADGSDLVFSTFLGGSETDQAHAVAVDSQDRPVVVGQTQSVNFPTTSGAYDTTHNGFDDAFVSQLSANGSTLVDSTFLGGSATDRAGSSNGPLALDGADNIYVGGLTCSADFPTTPGAYQESPIQLCGGFVAKFGATNQPPTVVDITAPADPVAVGTQVTVSADFTDPNVDDTHTCDFEWGDGDSTLDVAATDTAGSADGSCSADHSYTQPGVYTVTVTVEDDGGASDSRDYQYVVVYDPNGSFVTGGGWFESPPGAFPADPTLTGKASFGFVSKYKKGASVPVGHTEFQFKNGELDFKSDTYQWLVVAGARAQFKGIGTLQGLIGEYGFFVTAIDGQVNGGGGIDKFRIKIWDADDDSIVIYDNNTTEDDVDADPTTEIDGGSIVVHSKGKK